MLHVFIIQVQPYSLIINVDYLDLGDPKILDPVTITDFNTLVESLNTYNIM